MAEGATVVRAWPTLMVGTTREQIGGESTIIGSTRYGLILLPNMRGLSCNFPFLAKFMVDESGRGGGPLLLGDIRSETLASVANRIS